MVMKKIFDGEFDEEVHANFLKFGRGEYKNKYLLDGKKQAKKWAIKSSAEYANILVRKCLGKVGGDLEIKGVIVSTRDLRDEIDFDIKKVSNFQGVRKHVIDGVVNPEQILDLITKYPKAFFALTFKGEDFVLKIKPKAPAASKKGKGEDAGPVVDFCSLKTEDREIVNYLFFGVGEFKEAKINHTINVTDIVYPSNMDELKPTEVRELAKRKGVVVRTVVVDGIIKTSEAEFVA
jgi:hypothetical protein